MRWQVIAATLLCTYTVSAFDIEGLVNRIVREAEDFPSVRSLVLEEALAWAKSGWDAPLTAAVDRTHRTKGPSEYPFFGWIPQPMASVKVAGKDEDEAEDVAWSSPCFVKCAAKATKATNNSYAVHMSFEGATGSSCQDFYALATVTHLHFFTVDAEGDVTVEYTLPRDVRPAELWDVETKGIRIFRMPHDRTTTLCNLAETILLFESELTKGVSRRVAERNRRFVETYTQFRYRHRDAYREPLVVPNESEVKSGDFFSIVRFDGLDPMLGWGMGSTSGHTTVAMWIHGELYICESTTKDSYWPTDGIQRTPYRKWIQQAEAAGYNTVWAPLSEEYRARFNETAALEWFETVEGLEYGYQTLLWGWIDTAGSNYPCLPPDFSSNCLTWQALEPVFAVVDRKIPKIADLLWIEAWNRRLGVKGQRTAELYYTAAQQGVDSSAIPAIVEQDDWLYQTKRNKQAAVGRSMVCCVFVCSLWKHAGVLGDTPINCAELTVSDDYTLNIFAGNYTQVTGDYMLKLNGFNTRPLTPHYSEACPGMPPNYERQEGC